MHKCRHESRNRRNYGKDRAEGNAQCTSNSRNTVLDSGNGGRCFRHERHDTAHARNRLADDNQQRTKSRCNESDFDDGFFCLGVKLIEIIHQSLNMGNDGTDGRHKNIRERNRQFFKL